jgi:hypothetical protein
MRASWEIELKKRPWDDEDDEDEDDWDDEEWDDEDWEEDEDE